MHYFMFKVLTLDFSADGFFVKIFVSLEFLL